jgi:hypothetical protein
LRRAGVFLCLLLLAGGAFCLEASPLPEPIDLFEYLKRPEGAYGFPVFRLWGWSRDGKVAWSMEREVEGRGGVTIEYVVQDLVSDEVLWNYPDDSGAWDAYDPEADGSEAEYSYRHVAAGLREALDAFRIVQGPAKFERFPIKSAGRSYGVDIRIDQKQATDFGEGVAAYTVRITRDDRKAKEAKKATGAEALSVYACGYFASPYESRVAIVSAEERFVFEGTEMFYSLSGCNLKVGF